MTERILIDASHPEETRVVLAQDSRLEEFDFESATKKQIKGNIYLGKVTRVEPSLQAAFVEYGGNKQGFLPFSELHFDYYQIPVADKEKLAAEIKASEDSARKEAEEVALRRQQEAEKADIQAKEENLPEIEEISGATELNHSVVENTEIKDKAIAEEAVSGPIAVMADDAVNESIDVVGDDEITEARLSRGSFYRQYKIQEVLKRNQIVLVQVIKEERGNKGASLSTYISIAGRYCVLMPNTDRQGGVSRRIADPFARRRLKSVVSSLDISDGMSVIVRTAGVDRNDDEIKRDYEYLSNIWSGIRKKTLSSEAPALINEEGGLIKRTLRDMYRDNVEEVLVEGKQALETARDFFKIMAPEQLDKIKEYTESTPIFQHYNIDSQLDELYENTARLKSGGSIVITPTEALVSIDVNSGKSTRERSIENTAVKTNVEAAAEIARQLRLRDLAGLVVIDFIDMRELKNRRSVERALKEALKTDRAKIQVGRISPFGLLEMSRQRMRSSIVEASTITCPHCKGVGVVRSQESTAVKLLRVIEAEANKDGAEEIKLRASTEAAFYLLNSKRNEINAIELHSNVKIFVDHDHNLIGAEHTIESPNGRNRRKPYPRGKKPYDRPQRSNYQKNENNYGKKKYEKPAENVVLAKEEQKNVVPEAEKLPDENVGNKVTNDTNNRRNAGHDRGSNRGRSGGRDNSGRSRHRNAGKGGVRKGRYNAPRQQGDANGNEAAPPPVYEEGEKSISPEVTSGVEGEDTSRLRGLWKRITQ